MKNKIDLTIKPTMGCNMSCKHCFNGNTFSSNEMLDVKTACVLLDKACQEYDSVKVVFHGGEPSLAGIDFFKEFYEEEKRMGDKYGTNFNNVFTTNGVLLTDDFIDLLNMNNTLINISFDGPFNDILREQTDIVKDTVFNIRDKGGRFRCFCTISKKSVNHLLDIYNWFKENKLNFKTLPIERRGYAKINEEIIMSPLELAKNFEIVYRYWIKDKDCSISYSTLEEFAYLRRDIKHRDFWFERKIALHPDGKLYIFGRPNDLNYSIGTPYSINKLSDCFKTQNYRSYLAKLEEIRNSKCNKCDSKIICGGVNINIAYLYVEDLKLIDYSCFQSNMLFQTILNINDEIIEDFKNGQTNSYNKTIKDIFVKL